MELILVSHGRYFLCRRLPHGGAGEDERVARCPAWGLAYVGHIFVLEQLDLPGQSENKTKQNKKTEAAGVVSLGRHLIWDACMSTATDNSDQRSEQASTASALDPAQGTLIQPCPSASSTLGDVPSSLFIRSMNIGRFSKPILVFLLGPLVGLLK